MEAKMAAITMYWPILYHAPIIRYSTRVRLNFDAGASLLMQQYFLTDAIEATRSFTLRLDNTNISSAA